MPDSINVSPGEIPDSSLIDKRIKSSETHFCKNLLVMYLGSSEGRTPESVIKFVSVMKIKSIQGAELQRMWGVPSMI